MPVLPHRAPCGSQGQQRSRPQNPSPLTCGRKQPTFFTSTAPSSFEIGNADVQCALKQKVPGTQCLHSKSGEEMHFW